MRRRSRFLFVLTTASLLTLFVPACRKETIVQPGEPPRNGWTIDTEAPYRGPQVSVVVLRQLSHPPVDVAMVELIAPTGGHELILDDVEIRDDTAHIFLTLVQPGRDEIVTQALVTHQQTARSGDPPFRHSVVYVNTVVRGQPPEEPVYRIAAASRGQSGE